MDFYLLLHSDSPYFNSAASPILRFLPVLSLSEVFCGVFPSLNRGSVDRMDVVCCDLSFVTRFSTTLFKNMSRNHNINLDNKVQDAGVTFINIPALLPHVEPEAFRPPEGPGQVWSQQSILYTLR